MGALWNLSDNDANSVAIAAAGGVEVLVALARDGNEMQKELAAGARVSSRGRTKHRRCEAQLVRAEADRDAQEAECNALPALCFGHGTCLRPSHVCQCDPSWGGPQCDNDLSNACSYFNETSDYWASDGCTTQYLEIINVTEGRVLCACDHLTDFATMVAILQVGG